MNELHRSSKPQKGMHAPKFSRREIALLALGLLAAVTTANADVVTNVWINPAGGTWSDATNWQDGNIAKSTTVADFRQLASGSTVTISSDTYVGGLVFDGDAGDSWTINAVNGSRLVLRTSLFGYAPIYVGGGTLTISPYVIFEELRTVRKEGPGTLVAGSYFPYGNAGGNKVIVADGVFTCARQRDLFQANVHVTGAGTFEVPSHEHEGFWLGSYSSDNGKKLDLGERRVLLGTPNDTQLDSAAIEGSGTLVSLAGSTITAFGAKPGVTYEAREGVFQFGEKFMVGRWAFDDAANPGLDSSGVGNDLAVSNSVTIVDDSERGKVALFGAESSLFGTGPNRSIKMMPVGNESYTIAAWVKMGSVTPTKAALFCWGPLPAENFKGLICRRDGSYVYSGHGGTGAYGNAGVGSGWHHVAVTYDGATRTITVYGDGLKSSGMNDDNINPRVYNKNNSSSAENFAIGFPWSASAAYPEGMMMDDAVLIGRCLSAEEVLELKNGTLSCDYPALPEGVGLSTMYNGELHLFGDQTISEIGGDGVLGGVKVLSGETLTITGSVAKGESAYGADIAGNVSLVKDGASTKVRLTGGLSYTGSTRVKAGTLALGEYEMVESPFAVYDFESDNLGADASGNGNDLENNGATRVWDAERGSWVARFAASGKQDIHRVASFTEELTGNSDYTLSVWAKPSADCPAGGSFLSFGSSSSSCKQIQFRFQKFSDRTLVLAHWGGTYDFTGIPSTSSSPVGKWHHYVAVRAGDTFRVYVDGVQTWSTTKSGSGLDFVRWRNIHIGSFFNDSSKADRYFDGDMDDVCLFGHALDENAVKGLYTRPKLVSVDSGYVPDPVLHYAFEDASNPGKDSSSNGCDLTATGTLTCEDSPLGGKALVFDQSALSYLSAPLPEAIPAAGSAMTVTFWVQGGASDYSNGTTYPTFVSWGDPSAKTMDFMFAFSVDHPWRPRLYMPGVWSVDNAYDLLWNPSAPDEMRWHHFAISYDPELGLSTYIDGQKSSSFSKAGKLTNQRTATDFYLGLKPTALTHPFRGCLDEVKVYNVALTKAQVRAAIRAERHLGSRVLPNGTSLTVDAGATLAVDGGEHTVSSLSGEGSITLAPHAKLNVSGASGFSGTMTGDGAFGFADGAVLGFGDGSTPILVVDHPVTLGENVTVNATARGGRLVVARASSFVDVENLESWNAELPNNRQYSFVIVDVENGKELQLVIPSGFLMILR